MLSFKQRREQREANQATVKYFLEGTEITLGEGGNLVDSMLRRALKAEGKKIQKQFGHLVHPRTGERPEIHLVIVKEGKTDVQVRLVTDSPVLRAWLKDQGIVIGEVDKVGPAEVLDYLIKSAIVSGASDISLSLTADGYLAKLRVAGDRIPVREGAAEEFLTILGQVKDRARLDLTHSGPQNGKFTTEHSDQSVEAWVATLQPAHAFWMDSAKAEEIVIRISALSTEGDPAGIVNTTGNPIEPSSAETHS